MAITDVCRARAHHKLSTIWSSLSVDIQRVLNKSPENIAVGDTFKSRFGAFCTPGVMCLFLYRVAHYLSVKGWSMPAATVTRINFLLHKVNIPPHSCIGAGCHLPHPAGVTFCGMAGEGLTLYALAVCCGDETTLDAPLTAAPRLGRNVTVGGHAVVIGAITVGHNTNVAFGVRLDCHAPASVIVASKIIRSTIRRRDGASEIPN